MQFELTNLETLRNGENETIIVIKKDTAEHYKTVNITEYFPVGIFLNCWNEIIGINTLKHDDFLSPSKIIEEIKQQDLIAKTMNMEPQEEAPIIDWWNQHYYDKWTHEKLSTYDEITVSQKELEKYFNKTISQQNNDKWTTYYINPPCGFEVLLDKNNSISFKDQKIKEITIYTGRHNSKKQHIYFEDKNDQWVEDIDIYTNNDENTVAFVFERADLENSSTNCNSEQLSYIELYEELNPYLSVDKNRKVVDEWIAKHRKD